MELGRDGDIELHVGGCWDVGLCTGVDGSGGVGGSAGVNGTDGVGSGRGVGGVVAIVMVQGVLVEVSCMGVVSESIAEGLVVVLLLEGCGLAGKWLYGIRMRGRTFWADDVGGREYVSCSSCVSVWNSDSMGTFEFFIFF